MTTEITNALLGGMLIGLAGALLFWSNGKVMGLSGIIRGIFEPSQLQKPWRISFILGTLTGGALIAPIGFSVLSASIDRPLPLVALGGILVGLGTTIGSGCTSGHGVCGISRFSLRSMAATITFILMGVISVLILKFFGVGL